MQSLQYRLMTSAPNSAGPVTLLPMSSKHFQLLDYRLRRAQQSFCLVSIPRLQALFKWFCSLQAYPRKPSSTQLIYHQPPVDHIEPDEHRHHVKQCRDLFCRSLHFDAHTEPPELDDPAWKTLQIRLHYLLLSNFDELKKIFSNYASRDSELDTSLLSDADFMRFFDDCKIGCVSSSSNSSSSQATTQRWLTPQQVSLLLKSIALPKKMLGHPQASISSSQFGAVPWPSVCRVPVEFDDTEFFQAFQKPRASLRATKTVETFHFGPEGRGLYPEQFIDLLLRIALLVPSSGESLPNLSFAERCSTQFFALPSRFHFLLQSSVLMNAQRLDVEHFRTLLASPPVLKIFRLQRRYLRKIFAHFSVSVPVSSIPSLRQNAVVDATDDADDGPALLGDLSSHASQDDDPEAAVTAASNQPSATAASTTAANSSERQVLPYRQFVSMIKATKLLSASEQQNLFTLSDLQSIYEQASQQPIPVEAQPSSAPSMASPTSSSSNVSASALAHTGGGFMLYHQWLEAVAGLSMCRFPDPFMSETSKIESFIKRDFIPPINRLLSVQQREEATASVTVDI